MTGAVVITHDDPEAPELELLYRLHTSAFGWGEPLAIAITSREVVSLRA